jgi:hypothetical protein
MVGFMASFELAAAVTRSLIKINGLAAQKWREIKIRTADYRDAIQRYVHIFIVSPREFGKLLPNEVTHFLKP